MKRIALVLAALLTSALLVGAVGAVSAQPANASDNADDAGPPSDLPGPVPDFVTDVLGAIGDFLDGSVDRLGEVVSGETPADDADNATDDRDE